MKIEIGTLVNFITNIIKDNQELLNDENITLSDEKEKEIKLTIKIYDQLIDNITQSYELYQPNILFEILSDNYMKYDTKITFVNGVELVIKKDMICSVDGEFIFIHSSTGEKKHEYQLYEKGFNICNVDKIELME